MQAPCLLRISWQRGMIEILKQQIGNFSSTWENKVNAKISKFSFEPTFSSIFPSIHLTFRSLVNSVLSHSWELFPSVKRHLRESSDFFEARTTDKLIYLPQRSPHQEYFLSLKICLLTRLENFILYFSVCHNFQTLPY